MACLLGVPPSSDSCHHALRHNTEGNGTFDESEFTHMAIKVVEAEARL
jgi:hypothetical protein